MNMVKKVKDLQSLESPDIDSPSKKNFISERMFYLKIMNELENIRQQKEKTDRGKLLYIYMILHDIARF